MSTLYDKLEQDIRYQEGLKACINCGTCTAICPAAEFYNYDPRKIANTLQQGDEQQLVELLKSETIWYCGECMSCVTRCPRENAVGLLIMALRSLSQEEGYFVESEKGRQQLALTRAIGGNILSTGYCVYVRNLHWEMHPESGPVFQWEEENVDEVFKRLGGNLDGEGPGILRKIPDDSLDELRTIFEHTGALDRFKKVEDCSAKKAAEMGLSDEEYLNHVYTFNSNTHTHD